MVGRMLKELLVSCPACFADVGDPCTEPTNTGRRNVRWFHTKREERARWLGQPASASDGGWE